MDGIRIKDLSAATDVLDDDKLPIDGGNIGVRGVSIIKLSDKILEKLHSKIYLLETESQTIPEAINELHGEASRAVESANEAVEEANEVTEAADAVVQSAYTAAEAANAAAETASTAAETASTAAGAANTAAEAANAAAEAASTAAETASTAAGAANTAAETANSMAEGIEDVLGSKGDGLIFNANENLLYLTANGVPIGDGVAIEDMVNDSVVQRVLDALPTWEGGSY